MLTRAVLVTGVGLALGILGPVAGAQAPDTTGADRVTVLDGAVEGEAPRILRGSAIAPRPAPERPKVPRVRLVAGDRLWLVNPRTGDTVVCRLRRTSIVGKRVISCVDRDLAPVLTGTERRLPRP